MSHSESKQGGEENRRQALLVPVRMGMGAAVASGYAAENGEGRGAPGGWRCSIPRSEIADTPHEKLRGFVDGGVYTFKAIRDWHERGVDEGAQNGAISRPGAGIGHRVAAPRSVRENIANLGGDPNR